MRARYGWLAAAALLLAGCSVQGGGAEPTSLPAAPSKAPVHVTLRLTARIPRRAARFSDITALSMVSTKIGFAVAAPASGGAGKLLYTSDEGRTWRVRAAFSQGISALQFLSADVGFATTPGGLLTTADGGRTWHVRSTQKLSQVKFVTQLDGVAITQSDGLLVTSDGGAVWTPELSAPGQGFSSVSALPGPIYYALGSMQVGGQPVAVLFRSADGGAQWTNLFHGIQGPPLHSAYEAYLKALYANFPPPYPTLGQGRSVTFTTPSDGWVSLFDGGFLSTAVLHTTDGGRTWTYAWGNGGCAMGCNGAGGGLYPAAFLGAQYAWRYDGQAIDRSLNGGITFTRGGAVPLAVPPSNWVQSLQFLTPEFGVAGSYSGILRTTDGGLSWQRVWPAGPGPLRSISMTASGYGFAVSQNQPDLLLRTADGGRTWQALRSFAGRAPSQPYFLRQITSIWAFAGGRGLVYVNGTLYRTTNRGRTWRTVPFHQPPSPPYAQPTLLFSNVRDGWAMSMGLQSGWLYQTTDGGRTWSRGAAFLPGPASCQPLSATVGWCLNGQKEFQLPPADWYLHLLATADGGRHFTEVGTVPMADSPMSISFSGPSSGAVLETDGLLITQDAGRAFTRVNLPALASQGLSQVDAVSPREFYLVTGTGELFVTHDGGKDWQKLL